MNSSTDILEGLRTLWGLNEDNWYGASPILLPGLGHGSYVVKLGRTVGDTGLILPSMITCPPVSHVCKLIATMQHFALLSSNS